MFAPSGIRLAFPAALLLLGIAAPQPAPATPIGAIVGQVSQAEYGSYVGALQGFGTRFYTTTGNAAAASYLYNTFAGFGLNVSYDPFLYGGQNYNNVVATLRGRLHPDQVLVVGAHLDSTSNDPTHNAPGADDNASGMAAVLEMARVLAHDAFNVTIKFIGFNLEEQGLVGSRAYATDAGSTGEDIVGMLNFDMIGYADGRTADSVYLAGDRALVDDLAANAAAYTSLATQSTYANVYGSDHYYFYSGLLPGSMSAFAIETAPGNIPSYNPYYHRTTDTISQLDLAYASDVVRMGIGTVADLAGVAPEPPAIWAFLTGIVVLLRLRRA